MIYYSTIRLESILNKIDLVECRVCTTISNRVLYTTHEVTSNSRKNTHIYVTNYFFPRTAANWITYNKVKNVCERFYTLSNFSQVSWIDVLKWLYLSQVIQVWVMLFFQDVNQGRRHEWSVEVWDMPIYIIYGLVKSAVPYTASSTVLQIYIRAQNSPYPIFQPNASY